MIQCSASLFIDEMEPVMQAMTTAMNPPAFDSAHWPNPPKPPNGYTGLRVGFDVVAEMVKPGDDKTMVILGVAISAVNIQIETPEQDPNYPVYFEIVGQQYHYVVSVWRDRVEIEVCQLTMVDRYRKRRSVKQSWRNRRTFAVCITTVESRESYPVRSVDFPATENELRQAFATIVADCSK